MNINAIPVIGWLIDLFVSASASVPFWFIWTYLRFGEKFFYWLPDVYKYPTFFECVGLFIALPLLKVLVYPRLSNSNSCDCKESK